MKDNELLPGEAMITTSKDGSVIVTSKRVRVYEGTDYGSVFLSKISCIQTAYKENIYFLAIAIVALVVAIIQYTSNSTDNEILAGSLFATLVFTGLYLQSRKHVVSINSDSGVPLTFRTRGISRSDVNEWIKTVESQMDKAGK